MRDLQGYHAEGPTVEAELFCPWYEQRDARKILHHLYEPGHTARQYMPYNIAGQKMQIVMAF
jgi:hypothetical protein